MSNFALPIRIAVTGAAGQICYSLLFRLGSGPLNYSQKMTVAAMHIGEKKVCAQRS